MARFHKLLEQEYLKLDIKPPTLSEVQQNVVDKMVSSGKAKYEGIKKMNAVVSYDVDGQKGKFKIDPKGNVKPYSDSEDEEGNQEDQESATAGLDPKAMSQSDLGILKTLMNPQQKRIMDTVTAGVVNSFSNFAKNLTKKLGTIK